MRNCEHFTADGSTESRLETDAVTGTRLHDRLVAALRSQRHKLHAKEDVQIIQFADRAT